MLSSQTRADYFDVTLVGDDSKYNLAHKVVLATSSAKRVHPHPLVNFDIATFRFRNFLVSKLFHVFLWYRYRFRKKLVSKKVSVSVSKIFGIGKSFGIGFEKIWYRKKYRYWYRKNFGIEKVLVSKNFGFEKKYRYRFRKNLVSKKFGIEKSIGIGFVKFCIEKSMCNGIRKKLVSKKVSDSVSF